MDSIISQFNLILVSTVFITVMLVLRMFLRRMPKRVNMLLWSLVAIRLMCPFVITSSVGVVPERIIDASEIEVSYSEVRSLQGIPARVAVKEDADTATKVMFSVWLFGAGLMLTLGVKSCIDLREKASARIRKVDNVYICDDIDNGFVLGLIRPEILIPSSVEPRFIAHVIRHEKMHIEHKDHIWKILAYILLSLNWFNPLVWMAFVAFSHDIELLCDEKVTAGYSAKERAEYAYALLSLSTRKITPANVAFGELDLETRIKAIGRNRRYSIKTGAIGAVAVLLVSSFFITNSKVQSLYHSEWTDPWSDDVCSICVNDNAYSVYYLYSVYDMSTIRANINAYLSSNWEDFADSREDISFRVDDIVYADDDEGLVAYSSVMAGGDTIPVRFDMEFGQRGSFLTSATILVDQVVEPDESHPVYTVI